MPKKRPNIRDVAAKAGASRQTVSRVLTNSARVRETTRSRVLGAIETLAFSPDPVATSLATNRSYVLGIIVATFTGNAMSRVLEGADIYALQQGYQIMISGEEHRSRSEPLNLPLIRRQRIEGILIMYHGSKNDHYTILKEIPRSIPVVTTGYAFDQKNILAVRVNSRRGAAMATRHLIGLGHRSIAMITGAAGAYETVERNTGFKEAMRQAGVPWDSSLVVEGDWFVRSGYTAAQHLVAEKRTFSAVFAHSDRMALGCISVLIEHGLRVPEDVAVVGFNDFSISEYTNPPLTTVHYPGYELGALCAKLLIARCQGQRHPERNLSRAERASLKPYLVVRRSCGAAGHRDIGMA